MRSTTKTQPVAPMWTTQGTVCHMLNKWKDLGNACGYLLQITVVYVLSIGNISFW